jgi:hypothetical protein
MKTSRKVGVALGASGLIAAVAIASVYTASLDEANDPGPRNSPNDRIADSAGVQVAPGRLVLPTQAGNPATVEFSATNHTPSQIYITEARLINAGPSALVDLGRVTNERVSNFSIKPGETVTFAPPNPSAILTGYDASVVPGAKVRLELTLSDDTKKVVPLTVDSVLGQGGRLKSPAQL